ncbi:hypothetical protein E4U55_004275, partial [Claviceps digitariae]
AILLLVYRNTWSTTSRSSVSSPLPRRRPPRLPGFQLPSSLLPFGTCSRCRLRCASSTPDAGNAAVRTDRASYRCRRPWPTNSVCCHREPC